MTKTLARHLMHNRALRRGWVLGVVLGCSAAPAWANTGLYSAVVAPPYAWQGDCRLCHQESLGQAGTATQPFAQTLRSKGINAASTAEQLLSVLEQDPEHDTDQDGLPDVEELLLGTDPNVAVGGVQVKGVEHRYGCIKASLAPSASKRVSAAGLFWLALGVLAVLRLGRRYWR